MIYRWVFVVAIATFAGGPARAGGITTPGVGDAALMTAIGTATVGELALLRDELASLQRAINSGLLLPQQREELRRQVKAYVDAVRQGEAAATIASALLSVYLSSLGRAYLPPEALRAIVALAAYIKTGRYYYSLPLSLRRVRWTAEEDDEISAVGALFHKRFKPSRMSGFIRGAWEGALNVAFLVITGTVTFALSDAGQGHKGWSLDHIVSAGAMVLFAALRSLFGDPAYAVSTTLALLMPIIMWLSIDTGLALEDGLHLISPDEIPRGLITSIFGVSSLGVIFPTAWQWAQSWDDNDV